MKSLATTPLAPMPKRAVFFASWIQVTAAVMLSLSRVCSRAEKERCRRSMTVWITASASVPLSRSRSGI